MIQNSPLKLLAIISIFVLTSCFDSNSRQESVEEIKEYQLTQTYTVGSNFRDCQFCPSMITLPAGQFSMGSEKHDIGPVHLVTIDYSFAVAKFETTYQEWQDCVEDGHCVALARNKRIKTDRSKKPVTLITWYDAKKYVKWLSQKTGQNYRLLTEAEWEYATRAGTTTTYFWGDNLGKNNANCEDCDPAWEGRRPVEGGSQKANPFGLHDTVGNVYEWVEDCAWDRDYSRGAPTDGSAWTEDECRYRGVRGGSYGSYYEFIRSASRYQEEAIDKLYTVGMRVARDIIK
ncbi:MAG: formylglycine-generating enzyme family protein [Kangiellaceae bacterium]|nr:formylglycine-generating enzyme family protein [Kangiellaceae bacterium]